MPEIYIDHLSDLKCTEVRGVIRSLTRKARVLLRGDLTADLRGPNVLAAVLGYLDDVGLSAMSTLGNVTDANSPYHALVLVNRSPQIAENDQNCVDVVLTYEHLIEGHNQTAIGPPTGLLFGKGKTSIVEKQTNFFYPRGDKTKPKIQLEVGHQFPITDKRAATITDDPRYPRYRIQGGQINIPYPQSNYRFDGIVATAFPALLANRLIAKINDRPWMGMPKHTWLCSEVTWEINDPGIALFARPVIKPNYKFGFEFQYNSDTWNPTVAFHDQETGTLPAKVVVATEQGVNAAGQPDGIVRYMLLPRLIPGIGLIGLDKVPAGVWQVPALQEKDFDAAFGALFEGGNPPVMA